ncbi:MAG: FAD:protein FMN transferase [Planctomycetaceae bacterium]|nr:FAD:protein FMN transferase [Planctomycetaceae bacterium]
MSPSPEFDSADQQGSRRDFLTGRSLRDHLVRNAREAGEAFLENRPPVPEAGATLRMATRAMACEFGLVLNPGDRDIVIPATDALERVHPLEAQMTVYREESELSQLNKLAAVAPFVVTENLYQLLKRGDDLSLRTAGAFDLTAAPYISLWKKARQENRLPTKEEIAQTGKLVGREHVHYIDETTSIQLAMPGVELNLGGIGKGYALDVIAAELVEQGIGTFLLHGGQSTMLARGGHNGYPGWPIGLRNPLFTQQQLATILIQDCALSTSGSNVQFHRFEGKRYGHIIDPRTGWPVDELLSVTVLAPTAEEADALSTAFFVMGVEKTGEFCDNHPEVSAILILPPQPGRPIDPILINVPDDVLYHTPHDLPPADV